MNEREKTTPTAGRLGRKLLLLWMGMFGLVSAVVLPLLWQVGEGALCDRLWAGAALAGEGKSSGAVSGEVPSLGLHRVVGGEGGWMALSLAGVDNWPETLPNQVGEALGEGVDFLRPVAVGGETLCFLGRPTGDGGWLLLTADRWELVGCLLPGVLGGWGGLLLCWVLLGVWGRKILKGELAPLEGLTHEAGSLVEEHGLTLREGEVAGLAKGLAELGAALAQEDKLLARSLEQIGKGEALTPDISQWGKLLPQAAKAAQALARKWPERREGGRGAEQLEERRRKVEESTKALARLSAEQAAGLLRLTNLLQTATGAGGLGGVPGRAAPQPAKGVPGAPGGNGNIAGATAWGSGQSAPLSESRRLLGQARLLAAQTAKNTVLVGALFRAMALPGHQVTAGGGPPAAVGGGETQVLGSSLSYRLEELP